MKPKFGAANSIIIALAVLFFFAPLIVTGIFSLWEGGSRYGFAAYATMFATADFWRSLLLSVRLGRAPSGDDESTLLMLERSAGRVLGIVAASSDAIEAYERRGAPSTHGAEPAGVKHGVSFSFSGPLRRGLDDLLGTIARELGLGMQASPAGATDSGRVPPTFEYGTVRSARP